ncbi:MAG: hypothetical protein CMJ48_09215 [Planctomycetaceae bacterium]|nr:hypothetical protein [Planctomycetaceae bacterium]
MRNPQRVVRIVVVLAIVAGFGLLFRPATAQVKKGKTRSATTKQLMKGLVGSNCGALAKALKAETPDWEAIGLHAALLNESGHVLMADGRCPDGEWAGGAKTVQKCSVVVLAKVEAKDIEGARGAFKALTGGCGQCHKKHKPKKK